MAGARPKPTALKILEGNPGHRPINVNEPKPTGIPTRPDHLDHVAKLEWNRISAHLITLGLLTSVDRAALAGYCCAWSRWVKAEDSVKKYGAIIKHPTTQLPILNPYLTVANVALEQIRKFSVEFGLTPASRSRLSAAGEPAKDSFEQFMASVGAVDSNDAPS